MTDLPPVNPTSPAARPAEPVKTRLSLARILIVPLVLFILWLANVVVFTRSNEPGIVCMTPVVWLLASAIGRSVVGMSENPAAPSLKKEALLAGGIFGALMGVLYAVDIALVGSGDPQNPLFAAWSGVLCIVSGTIICALIALLIVALTQASKRSNTENSK